MPDAVSAASSRTRGRISAPFPHRFVFGAGGGDAVNCELFNGYRDFYSGTIVSMRSDSRVSRFSIPQLIWKKKKIPKQVRSKPNNR